MRLWWFKFHRWIALLIGLQLLAWMSSGFFMSFVPIETVKGEHNIREQSASDFRELASIVPPQQIIGQMAGKVTRLELAEVLNQPVWRVDIEGKPAEVFSASTGDKLPTSSEAWARNVASADFSGKGEPVNVTLIKADPPIEYRGQLPVWQVTFNDADDTNIYVLPASGKVVARRTSTWRVYDFLWSLHIMDYWTRDNFNSWLLVIAASIGFILTVTGFGLLFLRYGAKWLRSK